MGQSDCFEKVHRLFLYKNCGECMASDHVDEGWVVCKHPEHEEDEETLHDGWSYNGPIPKTCPLRKRRAILGLMAGA